MGIFSFKKQEKKVIDLPPPAPPLGNLPRLEKDIPSQSFTPSFPPLLPSNMPDMELPEPPALGEDLPSLEPQPIFPSLPFEPAEQQISETQPVKVSGGSIYVEVERYREILNEINSIRDAIRSADAALQRLYELGTSRDKEMDRWHNSMENLQKKLGYLDKTLFEGI